MLEYYLIQSKFSLLFLKFLICCDYKSNLHALQKNQKENKTPTIPITQKQTIAKNVGVFAITKAKTYSGKNYQ